MLTNNEIFYNLFQQSKANTINEEREQVLYLHTFTEQPSLSISLPFLLSTGAVTLPAYCNHVMPKLPIYCLLRPLDGNCFLSFDGNSLSLDSKHVAFLDCRKQVMVQSIDQHIALSILLITGNILSIYEPYHLECSNPVFPITSEISLLFKELELVTKDDTFENLKRCSLLVPLFTALCQTLKEQEPSSYAPAYLKKIKTDLDHHYREHISLEQLEESYQVNRFHICKDFQTYYQTSPIQYVNHCRLVEAEHLLQTTNDTITKIGQQVGIENTTHFINLFKQKNGVTPLQFRQCTPHV